MKEKFVIIDGMVIDLSKILDIGPISLKKDLRELEISTYSCEFEVQRWERKNIIFSTTFKGKDFYDLLFANLTSSEIIITGKGHNEAKDYEREKYLSFSFFQNYNGKYNGEYLKLSHSHLFTQALDLSKDHYLCISHETIDSIMAKHLKIIDARSRLIELWTQCPEDEIEKIIF